ncbi:MAG TPA: biotin/lipoyl-binding protein, partial [Gammaproteobacteria bacterium]|nr:biotin/lipoyl-binding protein [Gammaproteobacteria bacterium]
MSKPMSKMLIWVGVFFAIVFGIYGAKIIYMIVKMSNYQPPAVTISSTQVISKTWQSYLTAVGSLTAINGVELSTETAGTIASIRFQSGQFVKQGDVLITLDTSTEEAALKDNQAQLKLAKINYDREKELLARKVASQAAFDARFAELQQAEAGV